MSQTTTIKAGESAKTIILQEGFALIIVGSEGALGVAYHLDPALGGMNALKSWNIGTGSLSAPIGPFANTQKVHVTCQVGSIAATVQNGVLTATGGSVAAALTGTGIVGQPVTATLPAGVVGTLQFTRTLKASPFTKSLIAGAVANAVNSLQYTIAQGDLVYDIGCDASNTVSPSNKIPAVSAPSPEIPATALTLTGPTSATVGAASGAYTVALSPAGGTVAEPVVVTPTPITGVTFAPSTVTLTTASPSATFTANASTAGTKVIAVTNNGGLTNPSSISLVVAATATVPGAPTIGTLVPGDSKVTANWNAPASNGGSPITGFTVTPSSGAPVTVGNVLTADVPATNGTPVTVTVSAINAQGTGPASATSNSATPAAAAIVSGAQMFARPAAGLFYQGVMQSTAQGTSNPITSYDCEVAYRANADGTNVFVDLHNICKVNGDVPETFASMNLRFSALINTTNASGGTVQIPLVKDGTAETSLVLTGGQASFGTLSANTTALLNGRNFVVLIRITHEDGTSAITVPLGTAADYGATVLGEIGGAGGFGRGQEGSVYNSATSLTNQSVGGGAWGARVGGMMYRPLAVYRKDIPKIRSCSAHTDSIGSPIDSFVAKILNNAGIANINIGSGGESQRNYPTNTTGRFRVVKYGKTAIVEHGRNSFGAGLAVAQNASLALYAQLRAEGVTRIIQTTIGAMTTRIDTGNPSYDTDNQNTESNGIRIGFNNWLRSIVGTANGPDKLWDVEPIITTSDRLKWPNGYTTDGLHPTGTAVNAVVAVATSENWQADVV